MKVYSLYVSTISEVNPPMTPLDDLAHVRFHVNWKEIFGDRNGHCRVRARLISQSSVDYTFIDNVGSLRANFASNSSNNSNGFNIGTIIPEVDATDATKTYLSLDTTNSGGVSMIIPNGNQDIYLTILDNLESSMSNVLDYQLWLYFDVDDEHPFLVKDSQAIDYLFSPR